MGNLSAGIQTNNFISNSRCYFMLNRGDNHDFFYKVMTGGVIL